MSSYWQTLDNVFSMVRSIANKDSTTLPDSILFPLANKYYFMIVRELIDLNEEFYAEISVADVEENQREYVLPIDDVNTSFGGGAIKIQRVEISYDNSKWRVAESVGTKDIRFALEPDSIVQKNYTRTFPKYYFQDRSIFILPTPIDTDYHVDGNNNIRIYWIKRPDELSSINDIPDLPKDWLSVLQEGILYEVFRKFNRTVDARDSFNNYRLGVEKMRDLEQDYNQGRKFVMKNVKKNYT